MDVPFLFGSNANVHQHYKSQSIHHTANTATAALCGWKNKGAAPNNIWTLIKYSLITAGTTILAIYESPLLCKVGLSLQFL